MDLYFERCDGTAATVEDFLAGLRRRAPGATCRISRAGTRRPARRSSPATGRYDAAARTYRLDFAQDDAADAGPAEQGADGRSRSRSASSRGTARRCRPRCDRLGADGVFVLDKAARQPHSSRTSPARPVPSLLRGFSAPVKLDARSRRTTSSSRCCGTTAIPSTAGRRRRRSPCASSSAWRAARTSTRPTCERARRRRSAPSSIEDAVRRSGLRRARADAARARPTSRRRSARDVDPDAVHRARARACAAGSARDRLRRLADAARRARARQAAYSPDAASAGRRALRNVALDLLAAADPAAGERLARAQFDERRQHDGPARRRSRVADHDRRARRARSALAAFARALCATSRSSSTSGSRCRRRSPRPDTLDRVKRLMSHPAFSLGNPNRVRSLVGSFAMANPTQFHRPDGAGYDFLADMVLRSTARTRRSRRGC